MVDSDRKIRLSGQRKAIGNLLSLLKNTTDNNNGILLTGPSGSGKSFIANKVADLWNSSSDESIAIFITGDLAFSHKSYHPWAAALNNLKKDHTITGYVPRSAVELSKGIPVAGDFVSYILETFASAKENRQQHGIRFLNSIERIMIQDIHEMFKNRSLLIVIDNLHWLDSESLAFLKTIVKSDVHYYYPDLSNIRFLLVATDDQEISNPLEYRQVLEGSKLINFNTSPISIEDYNLSMNVFGYQETLPDDIVRTLYRFTGGNLALIKRLAQYLSENSQNALSIVGAVEKIDNPSFEFIEDLILHKLTALGASGQEITKLMEFAAVIGITFSKEELMCVSLENEQTIKQVILAAQTAELINESNSRQKFAHEMLRYFFLNRLKQKKYSYYQAFGACLAKLRPSDYFTRANCLFEAGDISAANIVYILGILKNLRDGIAIPVGATARIESFDSEFDLCGFLKKILEAYNLYYDTQYEQSISVLQSIEDWLPKQLLAEKHYLLGLCLTKTMLTEDLKSAKIYFTGWEDLKNSEGEIWVRLMTILMTLHINLYDIEAAQTVEKSIILYLSDRIKFDPTATYVLNVIRRNAMAAHVNEIACIRTKQSVEYFEAESAQPVQLYYALNNHAANLIVACEWGEAFEYASRAIAFIKSLPTIQFPEPQILANNYILSGLLSDKIPRNQAIEMFEIISRYKQFVADDLLIRNNYAIILLYANMIEQASGVLSELNSACKEKNVDPYYKYLIGCNFVCVEYIRGSNIDFANKWQELFKILPRVPDSAFLKKRHEMLMSDFELIQKTPEAWNNYLYAKYPNTLGRSWEYYSKGFLLSDLQLWYES